MLRAEGMSATGVEPTDSLRDAARLRDPGGDYIDARAEALPFPDGAFDLVVSYLTLIDIDDVEAALGEMARVLRTGGSLLIANLNSFSTAGGWEKHPDGTAHFEMDNYLETRADWVSQLARHFDPELAPSHEHLYAAASGQRLTTCPFRRARPDRRRSGKSRPL